MNEVDINNIMIFIKLINFEKLKLAGQNPTYFLGVEISSFHMTVFEWLPQTDISKTEHIRDLKITSGIDQGLQLSNFLVDYASSLGITL